MWTSFKVSAPGSLMLMGEHAVLHGSRAIACAVNSRLSIHVQPNPDPVLVIRSALGHYSSPLNALQPSHDFRFVLAALKDLSLQDRCGLQLDIESEFSHQVGLGSSAAVTVCAVTARHSLEGREHDPRQVLERSREIIREVQGGGSATDAAASTYGGVIAFRPKTLAVEAVPLRFPMTLLYAGYKTSTPEVIARVNEWAAKDPETFQCIYQEMIDVVEQAIVAAQSNDLDRFAGTMTLYQDLMRRLGVSDDTLEALIQHLVTDPGISAAKISGSGLGDCVVGLGRATETSSAGINIPVAMDDTGVRIEPA